MLSEQVKKALRERIAGGETVYQIAKACGVAQQIISRYLSGERDIRGDTLDKLAEHLGLELLPAKRVKRRAPA